MAKSTSRNVSAPPTQRSNQNHKANQKNANHGTTGTNSAYDHVQGNRGAQLNPNRRPAE